MNNRKIEVYPMQGKCMHHVCIMQWLLVQCNNYVLTFIR